MSREFFSVRRTLPMFSAPSSPFSHLIERFVLTRFGSAPVRSGRSCSHRSLSVSLLPTVDGAATRVSSKLTSLNGLQSWQSGRRRRARALASVRLSNCTCRFPAYSFHEDARGRECDSREGISEIRLTRPNSSYSLTRGNCFQP